MSHSHILIQTWRWVMHPKVWRFVGFGSAVVGLLCYALSSSFNYLFGEWNLLKLFLYSVFSFIICLVILFAKKLQHSRSLQFKAHSAFLVLTLTSVYSFFFDKVMNGKPDAYSLISCAAFAIMSLSLSRQTQCGFEVDILYFFLGCLIVQLMKIKLQLFVLGAGFSYSLIIIRASFSSIDARENNQYSSELQDGNSVVLYVDSLQSPNVNIASTSNNIDSPQLVISTDIGSMMEQLGTCVKALEHENSNLIQVISEHVKKYVEEHSQLVVTDPNLMLDALKPETIKDLEDLAKAMTMAGFEKDFSDVYNNCRRECLDKCLMHRLFCLQKLNIEDIHNMSWKELEDEIERWIRTFNVALKILFPGERRLCDRIFFGFSSAAGFSFMEICRESAIKLLNFVDYVSSTGIHSPERLFKILEVFETLRDLIPEFESLFSDEYSLSLRNEATKIWKRLGIAIRDFFMELEYLIGRDLTKVIDYGGGVHPITQHVMNYLRVVCRSQRTLEQVFYDSSLFSKIHSIIGILERNLEAKSKCYDDPSLSYIFLLNNNKYIVEMTRDNELGTLLGDDWFRKHTLKVSDYHLQYLKTKGTIASTLVQDFFQPKNHGGDVQQLLYSTQQIGERKGSTVYQVDVQEIEASPSQPEESIRKQLETEIRTIVISPAPQFGKIYKMPPEDGFTWTEYGRKEISGFKYPRSYYRCNHMKLYVCRAKKKVQQLGDNPNVFEVIHNGGHSCRMSLTIPSLFVPAPPEPQDQPLNISMDMTQTYMPPSSTSGVLSSGIAGNRKYINSMPEAKLASPADGGHHPMMDKILAYLVFATKSNKIKVVNGEGAFSAQTEGTMELLESILASKSEEYADPSLRHFFMMNNWKYLEVSNRRRKLNATFGNDWLQKTREKVQQNIELYQKNSWDKVLEFLKLDINDSMEINFVVDLMKEKLSLFNKHFTETCRVQCTWSVCDYKLRKEIIESLKNILLPAYGIFIGRFQDFLKNDAYEYIEYGMFDIHEVLDYLFLGNKTNESFGLLSQMYVSVLF